MSESPPPVDKDALARRLRNLVTGAVDTVWQETARQIEALVASGDHESAAKFAVKNCGWLFARGGIPALNPLLTVDRNVLTHQTRLDLNRTTIAVAAQIGQFSLVSQLAEWTLAEFAAELSDTEKRGLKLIRANGEGQSGRTETARILFQSLINDKDAEADIRAYALRGLSLGTPPNNSESVVLAERAGDAFLEAGKTLEAAKSYLAVAKRIIHADPDRAFELCDRVLPWFPIEQPSDRKARASVQHIRATLLEKRHRYSEALVAALDCVSLLKGIVGLEAELASSTYLAAQLACKLGDAEKQRELEAVAAAVVATLSRKEAHRFLVGEAMGRNDIAALARLRQQELSGWEKDEFEILTYIREAVLTGNRPYEEKIGLIERAQNRLATSQVPAKREIEEQIAASFAEVHRGAGDENQALMWYRRVLEYDQGHPVARQNVGAILWKRKEWLSFIDYVKGQIALFGEGPVGLWSLGHALIEVGDPADAIKPLHRAKVIASDPNLIAKIQADLDRAIERAPSIPQQNETQECVPVSLREIEAALCGFTRHVKEQRRKEFWRRPKGERKHRWTEQPESIAKTMLWSFLEGRFGKRAEILEEVSVGAGRIDLYLRFEGGIRIVIELKMCGVGYPSGYAEAGIDQLVHYMDNKKTAMGYLVVFDARRRDNTKPFQQLPNTGSGSILVTFVDVRPTVRE